MICKNCGGEFEPKKRGRKNTGFCCKHCADNWRQHNVYDKQPKKYSRVCLHCGAPFETNRKNQKYCSPSCASKVTFHEFTAVCECRNCGKSFTASTPGMLYCSEECAHAVKKDREENKRQKRRRITKEHGRQSVRLDSVYAGAGGVCAICGLPVPVSVDENDMWSATRDHIVPLTIGGSHSYQNCQLAHRICNSCKGKSSDFKIDWGEKMEREPGKWEEKIAYLLETLEKESSIGEAV